jgi:cell division control protein 24
MLALPGQCLLEVRWRGDVVEEAFTIKCRTEELLRQWQRTIMKAVEESPNRRRAHHLSNSRRYERGVNSPLSQFPGTPLSEVGPSSSSVYSYSSEPSTQSPYPYHSNSAQPGYPPNSNSFDDEGDDGYEYTESGRVTPSMMAKRGPSIRSLPAQNGGDREDRNGNRPRAQTEDSSSAAIQQWRNQTPTQPGGGPTLPRGASHASQPSNGSEVHSLRSSASSRQLRNKHSTEWSNHGSPVIGLARLPPTADEETTPRPGGMSRQVSHGGIASPSSAPVMLRSRSASGPIIYQPGQQSQEEYDRGPYRSNGGPYPPAMPPLANSHKSGATNSGGTLASVSSIGRDPKRFSSSSHGTNRSSGTSSQSQGLTYTAATSPAMTLPPSSSLPAIPGQQRLYQNHLPPTNASAVRVKVTYGEDTFVVVVLSTVSYRELLDKVLKKIRLCGDRTKVDEGSLRLRYQDEDGDKILITSEEDVTMAFEVMNHSSQTPTLVLFATVDPSSSS